MDEIRPHQPYLRVVGYCPHGCGQTLFLGEGGHITCSLLRCPDPGAVDTILSNRETDHVLVVYEDGRVAAKHPLRERIDDALFDCPILDLAKDDPEYEEPGEYRVRIVHDGDDGPPVLVPA